MIRIPKPVTMESQLQEIKRSVVRLPGGEDLFQEVYVKCLQRKKERDWKQPQHGFIRRVARTTSIDIHRRQVVRKPFFLQAESRDPVGHEDEPVELLIRSKVRDLVRRCIRSLAEPYRSTLIARYYDGRSPTEIAELAGVSINTVKTRLQRAYMKLRCNAELRQYVNQD